jgi:uncharacterized membrane protein HdeD (DUF308 family)
VLLILVGFEALAAPYLAALFATIWIGWGMVFGGLAEFISAWGADDNRVWKILIGVAYTALGIYILLNPAAGLTAIAFALAWMLLVQGTFSVIAAFQHRPLRGWGWWLANGVITLLLGLVIFSGWPQDSVRIVALLVGISLIFSGVNRLALATR